MAAATPTRPVARMLIGIPLYTDAYGFVFAAAAPAVVCGNPNACSKCSLANGCLCENGASCGGDLTGKMALEKVRTDIE